MLRQPDGRAARRERTRRHLLRAARELIEQHGAARITMEAIAGRAAVSRRTVYDQFGSRAGLLLAVAQEADRDLKLDERLAPVFTAPTGREAVRHLIEVVAEVTPKLLDLAIAFERARLEDPDANAAWNDRMASRMQACLYLATRVKDEGDLRPSLTPQEAADLIYAAISWQLWHLLVVERGWTPQQWALRTQDLLEQALAEHP